MEESNLKVLIPSPRMKIPPPLTPQAKEMHRLKRGTQSDSRVVGSPVKVEASAEFRFTVGKAVIAARKKLE